MSNTLDQGQARPSSLGRRSSFEAPPKMSLGDLPPPSFSSIAAGQRSVPALERQSAMMHNGTTESGPQTPSGTLTPGASGPLGLTTDPWAIFGADQQANRQSSALPNPMTGSDTWSNRVKSATWNEDVNGSVGQAVGNGRRTASNHTDLPEEGATPSNASSGLARSSSYSGDLHKRRSTQEGEAATDGVSSLKRTGSQKERHASNLGSMTPADSTSGQSGVRFRENQLSADGSASDQLSYGDAQGSPRQQRVANGSRLNSNGNSRAVSPEVDLTASMRNLGFGEAPANAQQMQQQQQMPAAANGWPQGGLKSNNVFGAPDQLYSAFYSGPTFGQTPGPFNNGIGAYGEQPTYPNMNNYRRDSGFAMSPSVNDMYGLSSPGQQPMQQQQQNGQAGLRRAQSAWQMDNGAGRPASRSPTYGFSSGMSRSSSAQYGPSGTDPSFYSGGLGGAGGFTGYPPYATGLVTANGAYGDPYGGMVGGMRYEDRMRGLRSPLLEEFRANRHRRWDLTDIRGYIVEFSSDQLGSRHLQTKLENASFEERQLFFDEILPNILQLSTDLFSNYVVQKAFEIADHSQKLALVKAMEGHILQLSLQMYGCRVIQKAIEHVFVDEQVAIVKELESNILKCARDQNANHVLQRILERVPADRIRSIPEACEGQIYALATHPYGCRVLQRILENLSEVRPLIEELLKYTQNLMQDQYSNYVIQHLLERGTTADRSAIISHVRGQLVSLSRHKFASNVIDKVILCASEEERRSLTDEILYDPANISIMLKDQYANYCLQKFMLVVQGPQREPLISRVAEALLNIRKYSGSYSKHLMAIEKFIAAERSMNFNAIGQPTPQYL